MMVQCLEMPAQMYSHFTLVMGLMNQRILIEKAAKIGEDLWKQMKRVYRSILWWQEDVSELESSICSLHRSVTCNRKVQVTAVMPVSLEKHSKLLKVLGILQLPMKQPKKDLKESMGDQKESYNILWKTWQLEKLANY